MSRCTANDEAVLNCIFNPLLPVGNLPTYTDDDLKDISEDDEPQTEEVTRSKCIDLEAIQAAERGELDSALRSLTESIQLANRASSFNNRAQVYRLLDRDDDAMTDLNASLQLSGEKAKSGVQALCQRGLLLRKMNRETEAKRDFTRAATLGSKFAKQQLVEMNPYAAMCNQMLGQMMAKLKECDPTVI